MSYFRELYRGTVDGWNRFWFAPRDPATLGVVRIATTAMLLYTHTVWTLDWDGFFGTAGWLDEPARAAIMPGASQYADYAWSHFTWISDSTTLWGIHLAALVVFTLLMLGCFTRVTAVAAWLLTISYMRRAPFALFGLDAVNSMLAMYVMIGPAGDAFSVDAWLRRRRDPPRIAAPSVGANIAIRLIQCHMCLIYFFSALGKLQGASWWTGDAIWMAVGNLEYQSLDAVWIARYPELISAVTLGTMFWELSYAVLIWPHLFRPMMLAMAVAVHLGIGIWMGMMTFGLAMLIGNLAFVESATIRTFLEWIFRATKTTTSIAFRNRARRGEKSPFVSRSKRL
ncbi:MAG: HTTM domain-containing protein [Pirellulales bacterium]